MNYNTRTDHNPVLIAEIGGNHEGNFKYALELTRLAIESKVDYIKFQIYSGDTLVSKLESPERNKHFKKFELKKEEYIQLAKMCNENNVKFLASVWNPDFIEWIDEYCDSYKIGSGDLTAYPVLKKFAQIGKPLILSTGLASIEEVIETVEYLQKVNPIYKEREYLSILQCTSMYPIPFEDANLNVMSTYKHLFDLPVGYSDHTEGSLALLIAATLGAEILEFHFTDSRDNKDFRDHKVSLTKSEVLDLKTQIENVKTLKGSTVKKPLKVEGDHITSFRRAIYPNRHIRKGEIIKEDDLIALRPNHGIDARDFERVVGKKLDRDVQEHEKLNWDYLI